MAIFLKSSFLNVALAINSSIIEKVSNEPIFKVGKKRRRNFAAFSKNQALSMLEEMPAGKKEENEDAEKIFDKLKFPSFSFMLSLIHSHAKKAFYNSVTFFDFQLFFPIHLRTHLSVSIIRI